MSGDRYCKHFTTWKQFLTLLYAQITGKDSLREIEEGLLANHKRLYHLGMEVVPKSTLSEAMNRRSPELFKKLFEELLDRTMKYAPHHKFKLQHQRRCLCGGGGGAGRTCFCGGAGRKCAGGGGGGGAGLTTSYRKHPGVSRSRTTRSQRIAGL